MALSSKQKRIAVDMGMYALVVRLNDVPCEDDDEADVLEGIIETIEERVRKYDVIPDGGLSEIVAYVKEHH